MTFTEIISGAFFDELQFLGQNVIFLSTILFGPLQSFSRIILAAFLFFGH